MGFFDLLVGDPTSDNHVNRLVGSTQVVYSAILLKHVFQ